MEGYVYILTNPAFQSDIIKIGKTSRTAEERIKELYTTGVPYKFNIYATIKSTKYDELERQIHRIFNRYKTRCNDNREFFNMSPQAALEEISELVKLLPDYEIKIYNEEDNIKAKEKSKSKSGFKFSNFGIKPGDELLFITGDLKVTVKDERHIKYEDLIYTLSEFTKRFIPSWKASSTGKYQYVRHFSFNGKTLYDIKNKN